MSSVRIIKKSSPPASQRICDLEREDIYTAIVGEDSKTVSLIIHTRHGHAIAIDNDGTTRSWDHNSTDYKETKLFDVTKVSQVEITAIQ